MAEKKTKDVAWLPILGGIGLVGGGLYMWSKMQGGGGGGGDDIPPEVWQMVQSWDGEVVALRAWVDEVTQNGTIPLTDQQITDYLEPRQEDIHQKELWVTQYWAWLLAQQRTARAREWHLNIVAPSVAAGTIGVAIMAYYIIKYIRPPRPPSDPKNPTRTFTDTAAWQEYMDDTYAVSADPAAWALADQYWQQVPQINAITIASMANIPEILTADQLGKTHVYNWDIRTIAAFTAVACLVVAVGLASTLSAGTLSPAGVALLVAVA